MRGLPHASIGIGKGLADAACGQAILAADPVVVRDAKALPQHFGDREIGLRLLDHAGAVLCPLPRDQASRGHHAHVLAHLLWGEAIGAPAPLRPSARPLRPQTMNDKAKAAIVARALDAVRA